MVEILRNKHILVEPDSYMICFRNLLKDGQKIKFHPGLPLSFNFKEAFERGGILKILCNQRDTFNLLNSNQNLKFIKIKLEK